MSLPSACVVSHPNLRDFLHHRASRYGPGHEFQQRLVDRTIAVITNDCTFMDEADIRCAIYTALHRVALQDLTRTVDSVVKFTGSANSSKRNAGSVTKAGQLGVTTPSHITLAGRRCLVVEDEYYLASHLLTLLESSGATVFGPVSDVGRAMEVLAEPSFTLDVAILDINLNGQMIYPAAELLTKRGTPFVFISGYGDISIPDCFANAPVLTKPFDNASLLNALSSVVDRADV